MLPSPLLRFAAGLLLGICSLPVAQAAEAAAGPKNATVLIIRHAEKPEGETDPGLTSAGQERAKKYASYFHPFFDGERTLKIDALFAAADSATSQRLRLTLEPLKAASGLPLNASIKNKQFEELIRKLKSGACAGKTILICRHHGETPALLQALGADAGRLLGDRWPDAVFGWVVDLQYGANGALKSSRVIDEKLLPDDTLAPPGQ